MAGKARYVAHIKYMKIGHYT